MDEVPLGLARQTSGLCFIIRYHSEPEVLRDWYPLVCVGVRWPGNDRYF
jgi:hypothetical protein